MTLLLYRSLTACGGLYICLHGRCKGVDHLSSHCPLKKAPQDAEAGKTEEEEGSTKTSRPPPAKGDGSKKKRKEEEEEGEGGGQRQEEQSERRLKKAKRQEPSASAADFWKSKAGDDLNDADFESFDLDNLLPPAEDDGDEEREPPPRPQRPRQQQQKKGKSKQRPLEANQPTPAASQKKLSAKVVRF